MTRKDIGLAAGGFADSAAQDAFCAGTTCTISIIYDQSPNANHLTPAPPGSAHYPLPDQPANATALRTTIGGHSVYAVLIAPPGMGYRNDKTSGIATGDQAETLYMVTSSAKLVNMCCFDYGNAETNNLPDGAGSMEAVYFGFGAGQGAGSRGSGAGPWVEADLENGLWTGSGGGGATNTPLASAYVTAMVVGRSGTFALRGGDAQLGTLKTLYDGPRPPGYNPMHKQGAIILGIGGDNSNHGGGEFYEGVITSGNASAATDDAVQANIVAAGYGR